MGAHVKFCCDCAHYHPGTPSDCRAPENKREDMITGASDLTFSAARARCYMGACGKSGVWFKPKECNDGQV